MILRVVNHKFHYETENLCRVFFPYETIRVINDESDETDDITVVTSMSGEYVVGVSVNINGATGEKKKTVADYDDCEREMAILLFSLLSEITGYVPKWGILTGVRPSKLMNSLIKDYGDNGAKAYFTDIIDSDTWTKKDNGSYIRTINKFKELFDVSPVYKEAYPDTSVALRKLESFDKEDLTDYYMELRHKLQ